MMNRYIHGKTKELVVRDMDATNGCPPNHYVSEYGALLFGIPRIWISGSFGKMRVSLLVTMWPLDNVWHIPPHYQKGNSRYSPRTSLHRTMWTAPVHIHQALSRSIRTAFSRLNKQNNKNEFIFAKMIQDLYIKCGWTHIEDINLHSLRDNIRQFFQKYYCKLW